MKELNDVNTVLMIVLCTIIGFIIGSAWGQFKTKQMLRELLDRLISSMKASIGKEEGQ